MASASDVGDAAGLQVTTDPTYDPEEVSRPTTSNPRRRSGSSSNNSGAGDEDGSIPVPSTASLLSRGQRLTLGIVVLILVDVIWVASSELTEVTK